MIGWEITYMCFKEIISERDKALGGVLDKLWGIENRNIC
jgi:hypothetical protein